MTNRAEFERLLDVYGFRCERFGQDLSTHARAQVVSAFAALKTQADKDGGDCAKGAGENLLDYAMAIAHERELDVLGHKHNSDEAVDRFKAAVERALSPTPSVVKQSLTATQTGEKGESDAH